MHRTERSAEQRLHTERGAIILAIHDRSLEPNWYLDGANRSITSDANHLRNNGIGMTGVFEGEARVNHVERIRRKLHVMEIHSKDAVVRTKEVDPGRHE